MKHLLILFSLCLFSFIIFSCSKSSDDGSTTTSTELFVSVGDNGTILTSSDGTSWDNRTSGTSERLMGVTYGNGLSVTVGDNGTILTSTDGTSWTLRASGTTNTLYGVYRTSGTTNTLYGVTYSQ